MILETLFLSSLCNCFFHPIPIWGNFIFRPIDVSSLMKQGIYTIPYYFQRKAHSIFRESVYALCTKLLQKGRCLMTFQEWIEKFHPDCEETMVEELISDYQEWQRGHSDSVCNFCKTGELPENQNLNGLL